MFLAQVHEWITLWAHSAIFFFLFFSFADTSVFLISFWSKKIILLVLFVGRIIFLFTDLLLCICWLDYLFVAVSLMAWLLVCVLFSVKITRLPAVLLLLSVVLISSSFVVCCLLFWFSLLDLASLLCYFLFSVMIILPVGRLIIFLKLNCKLGFFVVLITFLKVVLVFESLTTCFW